MSRGSMRLSGSAKERPPRAWGEGEGEGGEARSVVFYDGLPLWEFHLYMCHVSGRLSGGRVSNHAMTLGGSAKERPSRAWVSGEREGGEARFDVFYAEVLGGSTCFVL